MLLNELIKQYIQEIENENKSPLTIRNYSHYLRRFSEFIRVHFPTSTMSTLNSDIIIKYREYLSNIRDLQGKYLDLKTQAYHLIALRSFIRFLRSKNIDTINPEIIDVPRAKSKPLKFLDNNQTEILLRLAENKRDKCVLELILATGLRVSDLVKLNRNDVNFKNKAIYFDFNGKTRSIFLTQNAINWLEAYLKERTDVSNALFIRTAGRTDAELRLTVRSIQRIIEKYVRKANLPIKATPHTLRHTFAINLLSEGQNMLALQRILNHKNISTTQIYTHVTNPQLKEVHRKYHHKV